MTDRFLDIHNELRGDSYHVYAWKVWYHREGRHFDNSRRHPDYQLPAHMDRDRFDSGYRPVERFVARRISPVMELILFVLMFSAFLGAATFIGRFFFNA